jgi:hypothetical protein
MNVLPANFSDEAKKIFFEILDMFMESQEQKQIHLKENEVNTFGEITKQPGYSISNIVMHGHMRNDTFVVPKHLTIYIATRIATPLKAYPLSYTFLEKNVRKKLESLKRDNEFNFISNFLESKLNNIEFLRSGIRHIQKESASICYNPGSLCPNITLSHDPTSNLETFVASIRNYALLSPEEYELLKHTQSFLITKVNIPEPQLINLAELVQHQVPFNQPHLLIVTACIYQEQFHFGFDIDCLGHLQYPIADKDRMDLDTIVTGLLTEEQKNITSLTNKPIVYADYQAAMAEIQQKHDPKHHNKRYSFDSLIIPQILYEDKYYKKDVLKLEIPLRNFNFHVFRRAFLNTFKPAYLDMVAKKQNKLFQHYIDSILKFNKENVQAIVNTIRSNLKVASRFWLYQFFNLLRKCNDTENNVYIMYVRTSEIGAFTNPPIPAPETASRSNQFGKDLTINHAKEFFKVKKEILQAKERFLSNPHPFLDNYNTCLMILLFQCITDAHNPSTCRFDPNKIQDLMDNTVQPNEAYQLVHTKLTKVLTYLKEEITKYVISVPQLPSVVAKPNE